MYKLLDMKKMAKRKMLVTWPEDINKRIVEKQLEMEKETGEKVLKPEAAVQLMRSLLEFKYGE